MSAVAEKVFINPKKEREALPFLKAQVRALEQQKQGMEKRKKVLRSRYADNDI